MWLKKFNTWSSMSLIIIINTYNSNTNKQQNLIVLIYVWLNEVGRSVITCNLSPEQKAGNTEEGLSKINCVGLAARFFNQIWVSRSRY